MRRGEIWWAALGRPRASEPGYRRPVVILQIDDFNQSPIRTVVVVAITSDQRLSRAPGNVRLSRRDTGLTKPSVANVSQVATVDKQQLLERVATLPPRLLAEIERGVRLVLGL